MSDENIKPDEAQPVNGMSDAETLRDAGLPVNESESSYDVAGAALGALPPREEAELYAAAATDSRVSADLAGMEAVVAELARLAPPADMNRGRSAGIRSRLVARAAATHAGRPAQKSAADSGATPAAHSRPNVVASTSARRTQSTGQRSTSTSTRPVTGTHAIPFEPRRPTNWGRVLGGLALAAGLVIGAFGVFEFQSRRSAGSAQTASDQAATNLVVQVAQLRAALVEKDSLIASLTGMRTKVIDMVAYNSSDPMARIFWDQKQQKFIMYASHIKAPPAGRTYQVWLIASKGAPISAGTFMPEADGSAIMTAKYPMPPGSLRRIAVTEEPAGGMPAPTGPVVFSGVGT